MTMKVLHVVSAIETVAAGTSYSVPTLCKSLAALKTLDIELHVLAKEPDNTKQLDYILREYPSLQLPVINRLGISSAMHQGILATSNNVDIIHSHGLWMMPNIYPAFVANRIQCPYMVSPRGMISPWALNRSKWKKKLMWHLFQKRALETATCFHATAEAEYMHIRKAGFNAPVAIIPNGTDIPLITHEKPLAGRRKLLFLARIHPSKGLDILLHAWKQVEALFPNWDLYVAGPDNLGYLGKMKLLARDLGLDRVEFTGPVYGEDKNRLYFDSDLYVLPSHTENFGLTVAEALAHGVPAIVTHGAPWDGLETHDCGWWIELSVDSLASCLKTAMHTDPSLLRKMGANGREWMQRDYSWGALAEQMQQTYHWMIKGGTPPPWVQCK